jgi:hypothetical protein
VAAKNVARSRRSPSYGPHLKIGCWPAAAPDGKKRREWGRKTEKQKKKKKKKKKTKGEREKIRTRLLG